MRRPFDATLVLIVAALILPAGLAAQPRKPPVIGPPKPGPIPVGDVMKDAVQDGVKSMMKKAASSLPKSVSPLPAATPTAPPPGPILSPPPGTATQPKLPAAAAPAAVVPAAAAGVAPNDPTERLAFLRRKILRDDDFVDNDDINRDPFRSFLRLFVEKPAARPHMLPAIFDKFALEELALIAVVSGDANPRAMFRDPAGFGMTVKRGDYVSKSAARITKILSDRVIFELTEIQPTGESKATEKAVLVNPEARR